MIRFSKILDCIDEDETVAVFLEDDPESSAFEKSLYCGRKEELSSYEYYESIENIVVEKYVTRYDSNGETVLCIGLVC